MTQPPAGPVKFHEVIGRPHRSRARISMIMSTKRLWKHPEPHQAGLKPFRHLRSFSFIGLPVPYQSFTLSPLAQPQCSPMHLPVVSLTAPNFIIIILNHSYFVFGYPRSPSSPPRAPPNTHTGYPATTMGDWGFTIWIKLHRPIKVTPIAQYMQCRGITVRVPGRINRHRGGDDWC